MTMNHGGAVAFLVMALAGSAASAKADGAQLFAQNCAACHQSNGKGIPGAFPALAGDMFVKGPAAPIASVVLKGRAGMPSFSADLTDEQIAAILTYARASWGNKAPPIAASVVAAARKGGAVTARSVLPGH